MEGAGDASFDANFEIHMLRYKLEMLEKLEKAHEFEGEAIDECRLLQYKIECIEGCIILRGPSSFLRPHTTFHNAACSLDNC